MTSLRYLRDFIRLFAGVFFFLFTLNLSAQSKRDLTKDSPFLPPGYRQHLEKKNKKPPPPPKAPPKLRQNLELRGYFRLGGVWRFSVFDNFGDDGVKHRIGLAPFWVRCWFQL